MVSFSKLNWKWIIYRAGQKSRCSLLAKCLPKHLRSKFFINLYIFLFTINKLKYIPRVLRQLWSLAERYFRFKTKMPRVRRNQFKPVWDIAWYCKSRLINTRSIYVEVKAVQWCNYILNHCCLWNYWLLHIIRLRFTANNESLFVCKLYALL